MLRQQNHAAGGANGSIMVVVFVCLCLASKKPSEREFSVPTGTDLGDKLLSIRDKLAGSEGIFLSNQRRLSMDLAVCRIDTFVLIPTSNFHRPSGNSKEVDEGFNGTHFVSPLSTPILCLRLHTVEEATIDSGTNSVEIQNSNMWTNNICHATRGINCLRKQ